MFHGTADHVNTVKSSSSKPLTGLLWKINVDAPVRSSVCYDDKNIYLGTSQCIFYSINKLSGSINWKMKTGAAIHSSAAINNNTLYFTNNKQALYFVEKKSGKTIRKIDFGENKNYDWGFDYFYSSPTLVNDEIVVGIKDGYVYDIKATSGNIKWKYKTEGIVRSTAAVKDGVVYFGDTEGIMYAIDLSSGKEIWKFYIDGHEMKNEDFGFDRRAIISSPVITSDKIIFGGRDGFLYAVNKSNGKEAWRVDHQVSWVISTPAVKDSIVVTGTSDGRFIQAVNLNTGKEIWKHNTNSIVWSSPIICNNKVYIGSNEGTLYCLDLLSGKQLSSYQTGGKIWSSPVIDDTVLFISNDKGDVMALKPAAYEHTENTSAKKMVFFDADWSFYFKKSTEWKTKEFLNAHGYKTINTDALSKQMSNQDSAINSVIVFATNYFPSKITEGNEQSLLRKYLNNGGRVVLLGTNPAIYETDSAGKVFAFNFFKADSVLSIKYPFNDLRSMVGIQPAFATEEGKKWGIQNSWTAFLPLPKNEADIVLGRDENGNVSAWIKRYNTDKASGLIQIWLDQDGETDLNFITNVAEHEMR